MTDQTVVHIGENSPEYIAYKLFQDVLAVEVHHSGQTGRMSKKYILDTYAECLLAVRNPNGRPKSGP